MRVKCVNINYFVQGRSDGTGSVIQVPGATVTLVSSDAEQEEPKLDTFTLTFSPLTETLEYFPDQEYVLTLTPVQE